MPAFFEFRARELYRPEYTSFGDFCARHWHLEPQKIAEWESTMDEVETLAEQFKTATSQEAA